MQDGVYRVDSDSWPIVVVSYQGKVSDEAFSTYLSQLEANLSRKQAYWVIFDARQAAVPTAPQRQRKIAWLREHAAELRQFCAGGVFVIDQSLLRGALSALMFVANPPFRYAIVDTVEKGRAWIDELQRANPAMV